MVKSSLTIIAAGSLILGLSGCATTSDQQALQRHASETLATHHPHYSLDESHQQAILEHIEHRPLTQQQAIQLMLVNSPQVTAELHKLGLADAKRIQAGLISNPEFSVGVLYPESGDGWKLDFGLSQSLADIFTRNLRHKIAANKLLVAQLALQHKLQQLIHDTSNAYTNAVAAKQTYTAQQQHYETLLARQQLAESIYKAGNMSEVNYLFHEQERQTAWRKLQERKVQAEEKHKELGFHLGFNSTQVFLLPAHLPKPGNPESQSVETLFDTAKQHRQDLQQLKQRMANIAPQNSLANREVWLGDMELGVLGEREFDGERAYGPELGIELPLFNRGTAKKQMLEQQYAWLAAEEKNLELEIEKDIHQLVNEIKLTRKNLEDIQVSINTINRRLQLSQREVNFMLASPFDLLRLVQQKNQAQQDYIQNLKQYWKARAQLELTLGTSLPREADTNVENVQPAEHQNHNNSHEQHNHHRGHNHD